MSSLLLDIGGTLIKGAVLSSTAPFPVFGREFEVPVDSAGDLESISASLERAFSLGGEVNSVAVAVPGPFDYGEGVFRMKHKFASVYGLSVRSLARVPESVPMTFVHDVNCMLLGELAFGGVSGNVALVTLGTGLGFTVARDGHILVSPSGSPVVSLWNLPWEWGILEDWVSARGIRRIYGKELEVKEIATMAYSGDKAAREAFLSAGSALSSAIVPVLNENKIETLLFGGQISRSFSLFEPALRQLVSPSGWQLPGSPECPSLKEIRTVSDISHATFRGLATLI